MLGMGAVESQATARMGATQNPLRWHSRGAGHLRGNEVMAIKENPILMTPENAEKCFLGTKTQTRRIMKSQPPDDCGALIGPEMYAPTKVNRLGEEYPGDDIFGVYSADGEWSCRCPYGMAGDRLWVREAWRVTGGKEYEYQQRIEDVHYRGDLSEHIEYGPAQWKPSIHMPKWACRTWLEITEVRVQRLQEISEEDAKAEGVIVKADAEIAARVACDTPARMEFWALWQSINGSGSWEANPWVWAISFRKVAR